MQLLPKLMMSIFGLPIHDSNIFIFILRFSIINSVRKLLLANIPPTLAAALMITSGEISFIVFDVSYKLNKLVSLLVDSNTS